MHIDSYTRRWFPVKTIRILAPENGSVVCRDLGIATSPIPISGTYSGGTPSGIEARWKGGSWVNINATIINGTFSGILTAQTPGAHGDLEVRWVNNTSVTHKVFVGLGDVFVIVGDSCAEGQSGVTPFQQHGHATLKCYVYRQDHFWGRWREIDSLANMSPRQGVDSSVPHSNRSTHWPLLVRHIMDSQNVPVGLIVLPMSDTDFHGINADWYVTRPRHTEAKDMVIASKVNKVTAILGHFGPNATVVAPPISVASYQSLIENAAADWATNIAGNPPLILPIYGEQSTNFAPEDPRHIDDVDRDTAVDNTRKAIINSFAHANILPGPNLLHQAYSDGVHPLSAVELQEVADLFWLALDAYLYEGSSISWPKIAVVMTNIDKLIITYDKDLDNIETNYSTDSWEITDNGTPVVITSITKTSNNTIEIQLFDDIAGDIVISFGRANIASGKIVPCGILQNLPDSRQEKFPAEPQLGIEV